MFYKSLLDYQKNFKLKRIPGTWYDGSNGSSASFGSSRRTGTFRTWISFSRDVNSTSYINLGNGMSAQSNLIYNSLNQLVKKYLGARRPSRSQSTFGVVMFDRRAFIDMVNAPSTGTFITSGRNTYVRKSSSALTGDQIFNTNNFVPISKDTGSGQPVGYLFPYEGVYLQYNQTYKLSGNTTMFWQPVAYKERAFYFRRAGSKQFNFSNNRSFSAGSTTRTFVTTVRLYGQRPSEGLNVSDSPCLAVAKMALPVKKNDETEFLFKVSLQY